MVFSMKSEYRALRARRIDLDGVLQPDDQLRLLQHGAVNSVNNAVITTVSTYTITAAWPAVTIGSDYELDASTASDFSGNF